MLHIATVHFMSPRWIPIQARELRRSLDVPYRTWTSLEGIDPAHGSYFDHVVEQYGQHEGKLNGLALEIIRDAEAGDLLMFLDGDAFPIADPWPLIDRSLAEAPLLAVRRIENCNELQPHPCFCVTSVDTWRDLGGDWSEGGLRLLRQLESTGTPWTQMLRSNRHNPHPVFFAVYGDAVYHHGAGFREPFSLVDVEEAGGVESMHEEQQRKRMSDAIQRNRELSETILSQIERDDRGWLTELIG